MSFFQFEARLQLNSQLNSPSINIRRMLFSYNNNSTWDEPFVSNCYVHYEIYVCDLTIQPFFCHAKLSTRRIFRAVAVIKDLTDKPNQNQNRIESESGEECKGDINIS